MSTCLIFGILILSACSSSTQYSDYDIDITCSPNVMISDYPPYDPTLECYGSGIGPTQITCQRGSVQTIGKTATCKATDGLMVRMKTGKADLDGDGSKEGYIVLNGDHLQ